MADTPASAAALPVPAEEGESVQTAAEPVNRTQEAPLASIKFDDSTYGCCNGNGSSPGCTGSTKGCVATALNPILSLCNGGVTPLATPGSGILTAVQRHGEKVSAPKKERGSRYPSESSFVTQWRREQARLHDAAAGNALAVHAVGLTSTIADPYVQRPMLRLTVVDESTGMPLRRPLWLPSGADSASHIPVNGGSITGPSVLGGTMSAPLSGPPGLCTGKPQGNAFVPNMHSRRAPVALDITPPQSTAPTAVTVPAAGAAAPSSAPQTKPKGVTEVPAVWDETLLLPDDARVYLRPGVVFLFEVLEWGMQIPTRLLQRSAVPGMPHTGVYPVSWGFFRPVAADGVCKVHVSPPLLIPPPGTAAAGGAHTTRRRSAATGSAGVHQRSQLNPTMELLSLSNGIPQLLTREEVASMGGLQDKEEDAPLNPPTGDSKEPDAEGSRPSAKLHAPAQTLAHFGLGLAFARPVTVSTNDEHKKEHDEEEGGPERVQGGSSEEELPTPGRNARQASIPVPSGANKEQLESVFEVARPPLLRVKMYRWQQPSWQAAAAHDASMRGAVLQSARALDRLRREREDPTHTSGADSGMLGAAPPPVCLQYRLRGRQEAGYTLGVQVATVRPWWMGDAPAQAHASPEAAHKAAGVVDDWAASTIAARAEEAAWSNSRFHVSALDRETSLRGAAAGEELGAAGGGKGGRGGDAASGTAGGGAGREDLAALALRQRRQRDPCLPPVRHFGTLAAGQLGAMAVSFSPKGEYVVVGASDSGDSHPIRLYDTDTGKLLAVLAGHTGLVYALRWRADGRMLATASADGTARVWQIKSTPPSHESGGGRGRGRQSSTATRRRSGSDSAAAGAGDSGSYLAPALVATLTHRPLVFVYCAAWHPKDPSIIVTGAFDGKVRLWTFDPLGEDEETPSDSDSDGEPRGGRRGGGHRGRRGGPSGAAHDSSSEDEEVEGGRRHKRLQRTSSSAQLKLAEERGVFLGALGTDWTGGSGRRRRGGGDEGGAGGVPLSPATRHIKGTSPQGPHGAHVNSVVFDKKGRRMFTADAGGAVVVWELDERNGGDSAAYSVRRRVVLSGLEGVPIVAMALHPTLSQLAVLAHGNTLRLLDAAYTTLPLVRTFPGVRCSTARLNVVFSPDGRYVASGSEDGEVGIWETDSGLVVEGAGQAGGARSMYIMGFGTQDGTALNDVDWHPSQHMVALAAFGRGNPIMLYVNDAEEGRV